MKKFWVFLLVLFAAFSYSVQSAHAAYESKPSEKKIKKMDELFNVTLFGKYQVVGGLEKKDINALFADGDTNPKDIYYFSGYRWYLKEKTRREKRQARRARASTAADKYWDKRTLCFFAFTPPDVYTIAFINKKDTSMSSNPLNRKFVIELHTKDGKIQLIRLPDYGEYQEDDKYVGPGDMIIGSLLVEEEAALAILKSRNIDYVSVRFDEDPSGEYMLTPSKSILEPDALKKIVL